MSGEPAELRGEPLEDEVASVMAGVYRLVGKIARGTTPALVGALSFAFVDNSGDGSQLMFARAILP